MKRTGTRCIILFALPFAGMGLFSAMMLAGAVARREPARELFVLACAAVAFSLSGFGLIALALLSGKHADRIDVLRARHPDSPWLWNDEWANRRISDESRAGVVPLWVVATLWNAIAWPVLLFVPEVREKGKQTILIALPSALIGVALLIAAVRATLRATRFRPAAFVLDTLPAPIGGALRGRMEVPYAALASASSIVVRITSTVRVRGGKSTTESILWQDEVEIAPGSIAHTSDGVVIPIDIAIPADAEPTDTSDSANTRQWRLTVDTELPGIDYSATFPIPVFRTAASDLGAPRTLQTPAAPPRVMSCRVEQTPQGLRLHFPPFRAKSIAIARLLFGLLLAGAVVVMARAGAPLVFQIVAGLFALLLLWASLDPLFGSRMLLITPGEITIRKRILAWESETRIARDDIDAVELRIETQQMAGQLQPLYEVKLVVANRRRVSAAISIRSKREAEWVAAQLRRR